MVPEYTGLRIPIAVISDGKPGHENQSLGIAEHIPDSDVLLLKHNLRESFSEAWFRLQVRFSRTPGSTPQKYLRFAFSEDEITRLVNHSPRAIIAAGTLSAGLCYLAGRLTGAKTCICMKPSLLPLSMFDLAVVPAHDNPPDAGNIVRTLAAPNRVSPAMLSEEALKWKDELPEGDKVISWIIGGPSASARFDADHVESGLIETLDWANDNGWQIWLSTARRTPESLEDLISVMPAKHPALTWTLLWHRDRRNPLYAMFHRSRLAIVTSDSVSMIAEAAGAGCGPLVCNAVDTGNATKIRSKHDLMVNELIKAGYCTRGGNPSELIRELKRIIDNGVVLPSLNDTEIAAKQLMALIAPEHQESGN